jgi:hypothetical protein
MASEYREQRRREARESREAVHQMVREAEGKKPAKRVLISEALPEDHHAARRGDVILVNDRAGEE